MKETLRKTRKAGSSSLYRELAQVVSLNRCVDQGFLKLKTTLRTWFAEEVNS